MLSLQGMRVAGSGCVSPLDLDVAWPHLVSMCVSELACKENLRNDGRGLLDSRQQSQAVGLLCQTHGSALFSQGATQVLSSATIANIDSRSRDNANNEDMRLSVYQDSMHTPSLEQVPLLITGLKSLLHAI